MVVRGVLPPAKAWNSDEKGPRAELGPRDHYASMKMKHLRAMAGDFEAPASHKAAQPDLEKMGAHAVTEDDKAKAAQHGLKPESIAAARADVAHLNRATVALGS